jgi:hypothetical protein
VELAALEVDPPEEDDKEDVKEDDKDEDEGEDFTTLLTSAEFG